MNEADVVALLPDIIAKGPGQASLTLLENIGLNDSEIQEVLDIVNQGIARAGLYKVGFSSDQFTSYLDGNLIFEQTIELANSGDISYID